MQPQQIWVQALRKSMVGYGLHEAKSALLVGGIWAHRRAATAPPGDVVTRRLLARCPASLWQRHNLESEAARKKAELD